MNGLVNCMFCIDANMPAGRSDLMGELYERCPHCQPVCTDCDGLAVYPANFNGPSELILDLLTLRIAPVFCPGCCGVITLIPLG